MQPSNGPAAGPSAGTHARRLALAAICLGVIVVYGSLLRAPSLDWDDGVNIFTNPYFQRGDWTSVWAAPYFGMYIPVISTIWEALYRVGGGAVWPFRVLNLVLHLANVALFAGLLRGLLRRWGMDRPAALAIGTAVFALHPLQTAAVSWISGGRDLAATTFALGAVALFFGGVRGRNVLATLCFAAGLLCKPQIAGIPLAVAAYVWWFDRAQLRRTLGVMAVWSAMVVATAVVTSRTQTALTPFDVPLLHRPLVALDALGFYLLKAAWPLSLAADYGRTPDTVWRAPALLAPTLAALAVGVGLLACAIRRDHRYRFALLWVLLLLPVLGLVSFSYQRISTVADHYAYLPLAAVGVVVAIFVAGARGVPARAAWGALGAMLLVSATTSWHRAQDWRDNDRFFGDMLAKNPASFSAKVDLAANLCDRGQWRDGLSLMERALAARPSDAPYLANAAYCLYRGEQHDEVKALQKRLLDPQVRAELDRHPRAGATLASTIAGSYVATAEPLRAFAYLCQAQALAPSDAEIESNIASVRETLREQGRSVECRGLFPWDVLEEVVERLD